MLPALIAYHVFVGWLIVANPHPRLDKHHCWNGMDMQPPIFARYCWPKQGCFVDPAGNAMCWSAKATLEKHQ